MPYFRALACGLFNLAEALTPDRKTEIDPLVTEEENMLISSWLQLCRKNPILMDNEVDGKASRKSKTPGKVGKLVIV